MNAKRYPDDRLKFSDSSRSISAVAMSRFLALQAKVQADPVVGNRDLARSLSSLAKWLRAFGSIPLEDALSTLSVDTDWNRRSAVQTPRGDSKEELDKLTSSEIRSLIKADSVPKKDLVAVGVRRFGMGRAALEKARKEEIKSWLAAAVDNEEALSIISEQARHAGFSRSS